MAKDPTFQDLKEAALRSGEESEPVAPESLTREELQSAIREIISEGREMDEVAAMSERTAARLAQALWPEMALEVKKQKAQVTVERKAFLQYIKELLEKES